MSNERMVSGVLIDLDGVIYEGDSAVLGSAEAIAWLDTHEIPFVFVTNTTSRPRDALVEKLSRLGIDTTEDHILTPPVVASAWLAAHAPGPVALFVPEATRREFEALPLLDQESESEASAVVLGDLGTLWTYPMLNRAFRLLMSDPKPVLMALGMTRYWRTEGELSLDVGPFVKALEYASGSQAVVMGKPSAEFFATALDILGSHPADTVMVGDDIIGDVEGALEAGLSAVLVRTGKFREADLERGAEPTAVLDSIADLSAWLQRFGNVA